MLEIQRYAAFTAIEVEKRRPHRLASHRRDLTGRIAGGRLYLDYVGPHFGQQECGIGTHRH